MKKATIIIIIVIVLGILGGSVFYTLNPSSIEYVGDYVATGGKSSEFLLRRLYSSDINQEKMAQLAGSTLSTEFTDEEIEQAALKAGTPQFYPMFYFEASKITDGVQLEAKLMQGIADGQKATNFVPSNVTMEVVSTDFSVSESKITAYDGIAGADCTPVITEDGSNLAAFYNGTSASKLHFTGISGTIMVQYKYDISTSGALLKKTVLTDQIAIFYVTVDNNGESFSVSYRADEFHLVSDVY